MRMVGYLYDGPGCSTSGYSGPWVIPSPEGGLDQMIYSSWREYGNSDGLTLPRLYYNKTGLLLALLSLSCSEGSQLPNCELPNGEAYGARHWERPQVNSFMGVNPGNNHESALGSKASFSWAFRWVQSQGLQVIAALLSARDPQSEDPAKLGPDAWLPENVR